MVLCVFYVVNDPAAPEIYTLSLHDALPICSSWPTLAQATFCSTTASSATAARWTLNSFFRSEEHTSELQSLRHLVCRLLLEKKNKHPVILAMALATWPGACRTLPDNDLELV